MPNVIRVVMNHPERLSLLTNILNGQSPWLFKILSAISPNGPIEGTRIKELLEEHIQTCGRLSYQRFSPERPSQRDFLKEPETLFRVMDYLLKTLASKCGERNLLAVLAAIFVALERKEDDFDRFRENHPYLECKEALPLFATMWLPKNDVVTEATA